jgi:Sulfatase
VICGRKLSAVLLLLNRAAAVAGHDAIRLGPLAAIHLTAVAVLFWSEHEPDARAIFLLTWGFLNFFWLVWLRRPLVSAAISLGLIAILIVLSQFKHSILMFTADFVDIMLIDFSTLSFLTKIVPGFAWKMTVAVPAIILLLMLLWRFDPLRIRRPIAVAGSLGCLASVVGISLAVPADREDEFFRHQYVSKFMRSGAVAVIDLMTRGVLEADATSFGWPNLARLERCDAGRKQPHIVMIFDESSFNAGMLPKVILPPNYAERFRSSDGKMRSLIVEGAGGPSWYTEYNVLAGLSVRSYGRFADSVTRLAAGHVKRGLPHVLRNCGYSTYSLYSWFGAFASARGFHTATGIEHFLDAKQLATGPADTDSIFYDRARRVLAQEHEKGPVFVFVYLAMNHFPWNYRYRPDLLPEWRNPENPSEIDEYLRRQEMSSRDYSEFKATLAREFKGQQFLLVRFGDHQPFFAKKFLEPGLGASGIAQRINERDARYFTTYYALEGVNFQPLSASSALETIDAPYLPLVVLESAGVPLDATFVEQKKILERCHGVFYSCADGAEARRFNRLLMEAGLIQGF